MSTPLEWMPSAELSFPLDVDDAPVAQERAGGDAGRLAEGVVAQLQHRDAVDLTHFGTLRIHQQGAPVDHLQQRSSIWLERYVLASTACWTWRAPTAAPSRRAHSPASAITSVISLNRVDSLS